MLRLTAVIPLSSRLDIYLLLLQFNKIIREFTFHLELGSLTTLVIFATKIVEHCRVSSGKLPYKIININATQSPTFNDNSINPQLMETSSEPSGSNPTGSQSQNHPSNRHRRNRPRNRPPQEEPTQDVPATRGGRARGRQRFTTTRVVAGHQFAGQLSREDGSTSLGDASNGQLNAAAIAFTPGASVSASSSKGKESISTHNKAPKIRHHKPRRRDSMSSAPDISTRIHEDISNHVYECAICSNDITRNSKVWSCRICWTVLHLSCVKKWAHSEGAAVKAGPVRDGEMPPPRMWRCPGCNLAKDAMPERFSCWCEKEQDPAPLPGITPFSCGQTCGKSRTCPHHCTLMCHAGPCPPCAQTGPAQSCFCGIQSKTNRCVDTDYVNGWSCGQACNELMPCGKHYCPRPCHEGLCGSCEVPIDSKCFCGSVTADVPCFEVVEEKPSHKLEQLGDETVVSEWIGRFDCHQICDREFDCGVHHCEKTCHSQDADVPHCPKSPDVVTHCPCGKTPLTEISSVERTSCQDTIPFCQKPCSKLLNCGHECNRPCHAGDCKPCLETMDIACACGRVISKTICHQGTIEPPRCMRVCKALKNCGRHECGERCCTGERFAADRVAKSKKRAASAPSIEEYEAEHFCTDVCGRQLKCGNPEHKCRQLCHRGPCGSCLDAIFDEISCNCGRTTLQPPLPCGTKPPTCNFPCTRTTACGHPQVQHNCHPDEEQCPKCPYLVTKPCLCGKHQLGNQPCWLNKAVCGDVCGKLLKCGGHYCKKTCHAPGDCEDVGKPCQQLCGKPRSCGHPCGSTCHSPFHCKEDKPCQYKTFITCTCQRIKKEVTCGATKTSPGNTEKQLTCDAECLRLERNRKLQLALNIDPNHVDDHVPYTAETLNLYMGNPTWCAIQEKTLRMFASDPDEKRLRFKPMKRQERAFIHSLAQDFGFDSESMDPEPHRHIAIFKTPKFVMAPMKTVAQCVKIKSQQSAEKAERSALNNMSSNAPFNAFLVTEVKFGLTVDEVHAVLPKQPHLEVSFLPSEEIVIRVPPVHESRLEALKLALAKDFADKRYGQVQMCRVDESLNVERRETDAGGLASKSAGEGGWSKVAAKAATSRKIPVPVPIGVKSSFVVLGSQEKKKKRSQSIADDWEEAATREE
jgi:transcriptional repressor NF-X1